MSVFTIHYLIFTAAVHLLVGQWYTSTMMHDGNNMVLCYTVYTMVLNNYHIILRNLRFPRYFNDYRGTALLLYKSKKI